MRICDKCKKDVAYEQFKSIITNKLYDFCPNCFQAFSQWIEINPIAREEKPVEVRIPAPGDLEELAKEDKKRK